MFRYYVLELCRFNKECCGGWYILVCCRWRADGMTSVQLEWRNHLEPVNCRGFERCPAVKAGALRTAVSWFPSSGPSYVCPGWGRRIVVDDPWIIAKYFTYFADIIYLIWYLYNIIILCIWIYGYVYVCVCMYMYVCIYMYMYIYVYMYVCVCICIYILFFWFRRFICV